MKSNKRETLLSKLMAARKNVFCAIAAAALGLCCLGSSASAQFYQENSLGLFYGDGFRFGGNGIDETSRTMLEFQHFSAYNSGDLYLFFDSYRDHDWDGSSPRLDYYGEAYAHLSGKSLGLSFGDGVLSDIGLGVGLNAGNDFLVGIYGARASFKVPGFSVLTLGAYAYDNIVDPFNRNLDTTYQVTLVWDAPFTVGSQKFSTGGVVDWIGSQGSGVAKQVYFQPEVRWDVGNALGQKEGSFLAGLRYVHFRNKYGVEGVNDNAVSAFLLKKF